MNTHLLNVYDRLPISISHGKGVFLWDSEGREYLDAISGIGVNALGHCHPVVVAAIQEQASRVLHVGNVVSHEPQQKAAQKLCKLSGMDKVFFSNSGAEANEAALKLARLYAKERHIANPQVIVCEGAFHGRSLATLSAGSGQKLRTGFEPFMPGFLAAPFNDIPAIHRLAQEHSNIVAILVEPIQGAGGIQIPAPDYLQQLRTVCDSQGWLLILDEIQTGLCRTGAFYAYQHHPAILPDVVTSAKALANGLPISACLTRGVANTLFSPGRHGSTFGGNPLACHVAHSVLSYMESENLAHQVAKQGPHLLNLLQTMAEEFPFIKAVRGKGYMLGLELAAPIPHLAKRAAENGILITVAAEKVIRLLPPLIMGEEYFETLVARLRATLLSYQPLA